MIGRIVMWMLRPLLGDLADAARFVDDPAFAEAIEQTASDLGLQSLK
jgi:hypothetical protein